MAVAPMERKGINFAVQDRRGHRLGRHLWKLTWDTRLIISV